MTAAHRVFILPVKIYSYKFSEKIIWPHQLDVEEGFDPSFFGLSHVKNKTKQKNKSPEPFLRFQLILSKGLEISFGPVRTRVEIWSCENDKRYADYLTQEVEFLHKIFHAEEEEERKKTLWSCWKSKENLQESYVTKATSRHVQEGEPNKKKWLSSISNLKEYS